MFSAIRFREPTARGAVGCALMIVCSVCGCRPKDPPRMSPPPATVTVARPVQASVIEWDEFTGRLEAVEYVEVRARVGGLITAARFQEGSIVQSGDLMVEIDVRPYQAALDARLAEAAGARAQVKLAQIEHDRIAGIPESARSNTEFDNAAAMLERAKALLAAAEAQVAAARLDVEWCRVTAPISGRVSKKYVTPGNLITGGNGQGTLLTTIASVDPIYCYINCDERSVLKYTKLARTGERVSARHARIPTAIQLADETGYPHVGEVDFVDNRVDPNTGTIRGRGVFPNPDGAMIPGFFARVIIPGSGRYEATLVPDSAVVTDQNAKLLMVVGPDHVVHPKPVVLGAIFGELRAIKSGIGPDDWVVINGLMHARPGATVKPVETSIPPEHLPRDIPSLPEPPENSNNGAAAGTPPARPEGGAP